ncbi:MAG: hypothetical protein RIA71_09870 [Oceanicaulis sp.]
MTAHSARGLGRAKAPSVYRGINPNVAKKEGIRVSMTITASCQSCGLVFPSRLISVQGKVENLQLSGNSESCPRCGAMATTQEGIFTIIEGVITSFREIRPSRDQAIEIARILEEHKNNLKNESETLREIGSVNPRFVKIARTLIESGYIALLMSLISIYITLTADEKTSITNQAMLDELQSIAESNVAIAAEIERLNAPQETSTAQVSSRDRSQHQSAPSSASRPKPLVSNKPNRHERRKQAALRRRTR